MRFLFVVSHVCLPASFRPLLTETPLPSARTFVSIHNHEHHWFSYRGLPPHKLTPVPGVHKSIQRMPLCGTADFYRWGGKFNIMSLPTITEIQWAVTNTEIIWSPPHRVALSLRSPQRFAVRPLIEAAHQSTGAHCSLRFQTPSGFSPLPQSLSATRYAMEVRQ